MEKILAEFPQDVRPAFAALMEREYGEVTIRREGNGYVLESPPGWAFWFRLTLVDASGLPEDHEVWLLDPNGLKQEGNGYLLTCDVSYLDWEDEREVELRFTGAEGEMGPLALYLTPWIVRPWQSLAAAGMELLGKAETAPELVNDRERALLPLMRELGMLFGWTGLPEPGARWEFPLLRTRLGPELYPYLLKYEQTGNSWKKQERHRAQILKRLNTIEYLPQWRSIRDEIAWSQADYPRYSAVSADVVRRIEEELHRRGYGGSYPDFEKDCTIENSRFFRSCGHYRWIRKGNRAVAHIHVKEQSMGGLVFLCGTELLGDGERSLGFDSCFFDGMGRRFLRTVEWYDGSEDDLEKKITAAGKKAELKKLSRAEAPDREILWPLFWIAFLVGGTFFAGCMVIGMALISALIALILEGPGAVWPLLAGLPWMKFFAQTLFVTGGILSGLLLLTWDET